MKAFPHLSKQNWVWFGAFAVLIGTSCSLSAHSSHADDASVNADALAKTQQLLDSPTERNQIIAKDPAAQQADAQAKSLLGGQGTEQMYKLTGDILNDLVKETGGDVDKMNEIMLKAKSNPQWFAEHLSQKNQDAIKGIADQAPGSTTSPTNTATNSATSSGTRSASPVTSSGTNSGNSAVIAPSSTSLMRQPAAN